MTILRSESTTRSQATRVVDGKPASRRAVTKLSVVIPAHNEEENLPLMIPHLLNVLQEAGIESEVVLVNDNSVDGTAELMEAYAKAYPNIRIIHRNGSPGFGKAIRDGISQATGDAVAVVMGDCSDDPEDLVRMYRTLEQGVDAVFGSRFMPGGSARDYPKLKWAINRLANMFLQVLFFSSCNDLTNAFKLYRQDVLQAISPIEADHFNITAELPLKTLKAGFRVAVVPTQWFGRTSGVSKLGILRMGRHYLSTALSVRWAFRPTRSGDGTSQRSAVETAFPLKSRGGVRSYLGWLVMGMPLLFYFILPNKDFTLDSVSYALQMEEGDVVGLWHPHHLIYNFIGAGIFRFNRWLGIPWRALDTMLFVNAVAAWLGVILCWRFMQKLVGREQFWLTLLLVAIYASCYGIWYYSGQNEPYVLSLLPGLIVGIGLVKAISRRAVTSRQAAVWGALIGLACILHQMHIVFLSVMVLGIWLTRSPQRLKIVVTAVGVTLAVTGAAYIAAGFATGQLPNVQHWYLWTTHYMQSGFFGRWTPQTAFLWPVGLFRAVTRGTWFKQWIFAPSMGWTTLVCFGVLAVTWLVLGWGCVQGVRAALARESTIHRTALFLIGWILAYGVFTAWVSPLTEEFWIPALPALVGLVVFGWWWEAQRRPVRPLRTIGLLALTWLGILGINVWSDMYPNAVADQNEVLQLCQVLHAKRVSDKDLVLMYDILSPYYQYYYRQSLPMASLGWYRVQSPQELEQAGKLIRENMEAAWKRGGRVLISESEIHPNPHKYYQLEFLSPADYARCYAPYQSRLRKVFSYQWEGQSMDMLEVLPTTPTHHSS